MSAAAALPPSRKDDMPDGRWLRRAGRAMLIAGLGLAFALRLDRELAADLWWTPPLLMVAGAFLLYRGKQLAAAARSSKLGALLDHEAPVVYLRPFRGDESPWGQVLGALLTARMFTAVLSDEEQLAEAVLPIGPLVAIGQPGEALPKPGAVRTYPARWRESVEELLRKARVVIVRPGTSEGVLWEIEHAFATLGPEKVVVLLKRMKKSDYLRTRGAIAKACGVELPAYADVRRWRRAHALIDFGADWKPRVLPLKAPYWRVGARKPMVHIFRYALLPVFRRLGAPWQPSPVSTGKVVVVAFFGLIAAAIVGVAVPALVTSSRLDEGPALDHAAGKPSGPENGAPTVASSPEEVAVDGSSAPEARLVAGIRIAFSGGLQPSELDLPPEVRARLERSESYVLRDGSLELSISRIDVKPGVGIDVVGAAKGAVEAVRRMSGVTDMQSSFAETSISGHRAVRTTASYQLDGERWLSEGLTFSARRSLWSVQAVVPRSQDTTIATRVIGSVELPGP